MVNTEKHIEDLKEIRAIMEKSTLFLSLSGLSGVFAGIFALIGAGVAYWYLDLSLTSQRMYDYRGDSDFYTFFIVDAGLVLLFSLIAAVLLTIKRTKKEGREVWNSTSRRLMVNMLIPLITGGIFTLIIITYHPGLAASSTLLFYGMALVNSSKYTRSEVRSLGIAEIILGLLSAWWIGYGLLFWAVGFGVLHIIYGIYMYKRYES